MPWFILVCIVGLVVICLVMSADEEPENYDPMIEEMLFMILDDEDNW